VLWSAGKKLKTLPLPAPHSKAAEMTEFRFCASSVQGQEHALNPNFLTDGMEDGTVETSCPSPAELGGFCARPEDWFNDLVCSFLPHRGLMD